MGSTDKIIEPRVLKGFRDVLPAVEMERRRISGILEASFRRYGFVPIDTPVLEYTEVLLGKAGGETEKQIYRFEDHGGRDVAMRFDLTVPFARYIAGNRGELYLPFKRYHIGKVYRGENTQRGRYREFAQCDFDTVGVDSAAADFDILLTIVAAFRAMDIPDVTVRISHRGLFNGLLDRLGIAEHSVELLRVVDKRSKIGEEETARQIADLVGYEAAAEVLEFIRPVNGNRATAEKMIHLAVASASPAGGPATDAATQAAERMRAILGLAEATGIDDVLLVDPSITRGLDYYTGLVFETVLNDLPDIGSVCGGGRYNDLASLYTREHIPGVGASIGMDRLMAALDELGRLAGDRPGADVLVFCLDETLSADYLRVAEALRAGGLNVDVYPESKKLGTQFSYAEKKGIPLGVLFGPEEKTRGTVNLKDLRSRESVDDISLQDAARRAAELLGR